MKETILIFMLAAQAAVAGSQATIPDHARKPAVVREKPVKKEAKKKKHKKKKAKKKKWKSIGECRITEYCPICNDPEGYESSSGKELQNGDVACNWLPNGTRIRIDGKEYTVNDYCGTEAIDIFIDTDECWCDKNAYEEVYIKEE